MNLSAKLWNVLAQEVVGHGRSREADLSELAADLHHIQERILAQAAARAFPTSYRTLGNTIIQESDTPGSATQ